MRVNGKVGSAPVVYLGGKGQWCRICRLILSEAFELMSVNEAMLPSSVGVSADPAIIYPMAACRVLDLSQAP